MDIKQIVFLIPIIFFCVYFISSLGPRSITDSIKTSLNQHGDKSAGGYVIFIFSIGMFLGYFIYKIAKLNFDTVYGLAIIWTFVIIGIFTTYSIGLQKQTKKIFLDIWDYKPKKVNVFFKWLNIIYVLITGTLTSLLMTCAFGKVNDLGSLGAIYTSVVLFITSTITYGCISAYYALHSLSKVRLYGENLYKYGLVQKETDKYIEGYYIAFSEDYFIIKNDKNGAKYIKRDVINYITYIK